MSERRRGARWVIEGTPQPAGATGNILAGVSCWSAARCTAVGSFTDRAGTLLTLAQRSF
jgi:hypothetical protein